MKYEWIDEFLMKMPGVTKDIQKEWNWIRYHIGGKMFAAVCLDDNDKPYYITLKLEPMEGEFWRGQFEDVIPGYYMNKIHWNSIRTDGAVPDDIVKDMLDHSYRLLLNSLSRKKRKEILDMAAKEELISCCGADCSSCYCYGNICKGCNAVCGKVFHVPEGKECPVYVCCRIREGYYSCVECEKLPCELILATRDPKMSDEEFEQNVADRVKRLKGAIR